MAPGVVSKDYEQPQTTDDALSEMTQLPIVFVIGGPASGKGTQCKMIKERFGFAHISAGELLRKEIESKSSRGQELNSIMQDGDLVPPEIMLDLLHKAIKEESPKPKGYLIDGFPREVAQALAFEKQVRECAIVLYFDLPTDVMTERMNQRKKSSGREDDNEETFKKRLQTFTDQTLPVVEHYKKSNKTIVVEANRDAKEVFDEVMKVLQQHKLQPVS